MLALEKDGVAYNYIADGNKNICQLIDMNSGTIANRYDYKPFGALATNEETVINPFKFSSEYNETETDLIYYNYRYYNPTTGKWLKRDPIMEDGGVNIYAMLGADPINYFDLLGLITSRVKKEKCTVVLFWGHGGDTKKALDNFNKNDKGCAVASGLGCNVDGRNIGNGISDYINKEGKNDSHFPNCSTGFIGISNRSAKVGGNAGENDMDDENITRRAANGFAKLLAKAWEQAINKGLSMAADCKCDCKVITVEFRGTSYTDAVGTKNIKKRLKRSDYADNPGRNVSKSGGLHIVNKYPRQGKKHYFRCQKNAKK